LSIPEIIALFFAVPDLFTKPNMAHQINRITNQNFNPDMGYIGRRFRIQPHLMYDPAKSDNPGWIDDHEDINMTWIGEVLGSMPDGTFDVMSYQVPRLEESLMTFPLSDSEYNPEVESYGEGRLNAPVFAMLRYRTDRISLARMPYFATLYDGDRFDPALNWTFIREGISLHKNDVIFDIPQKYDHSLMSFLLTIPSETAFADAEVYPKVVNNQLVYLPIIVDGVTLPYTFDNVFGLLEYQITWHQIVELIDALYGYTGSGTDETGDHYLRWYSTPPDRWDQDYTSTENPRPIIKNRGIWYNMWKTIAYHGDSIGLFVPDVSVVFDVSGGEKVSSPRPAAPEGYFWISINDLAQYFFYELPDEVYLQAVVADTRRVRYETPDLAPTSKLKRVTIYENNDFKKIRLGRSSIFDIDYRNDYARAGLIQPNYDKIQGADNLPADGVITSSQYLDPTTYPSGYTVRDDSSNIRQSNPPPGVLHVGEVLNTGTEYDPAKSKMGQYAASKTGRSDQKVQKYTIQADEMNFVAQIGDKARFNSASSTENLRITEIVHRFYGGDISSSNQSTITISAMLPRR
jgi:hypothetical protein